MLVFGAFGKFGALFVTIPDPIIGGVFIVMFGKHWSNGKRNCLMSVQPPLLYFDTGNEP